MVFQQITVAGCGVLGSQIAFQTAFKGFDVTVYDLNEEALSKAKERILKLMNMYQKDLRASQQDVENAFHRIYFSSNLEEAVAQADLLIEAVPEVIQIKTEFYKQLAKVAPPKTIFATNSSTFLPSQFAEFTGRPEKFLALHFANSIWIHNTAEVMQHPGTDKEVFKDVIAFAEKIGMVPLPLYKEQPGYILNSLLVPFLEAAQFLLVNEIADVATIDKTWMIATGAPAGPFAILDTIGVNTAYNIAKEKAKAGHPEYEKLANMLKTQYMDKGKLGRQSNEGFYTYPNPRFRQPDFLKG
ncbi:3-hydroxyacyl-CoA dehydrogenase [Alicyclobacillus tolerans]|uniref:3-hydroxybutyryl-CoA dehydrogenase n=1 Tax=Alicyclobacillus tolerans TaxID=90970 RepID=A0A1M6SLE1_9BACL|nr:3-hydroxyacyl-CoA dehydrogenase [Alicyclobacillus montanus]SHK45408.1 3-hydroxybutyryl-CoA dehydrogenase [Alicyclobacillus montanus]